MYAWGGTTSDWRGSTSYDFDDARAPYLDTLARDASARGPRSYDARRVPDMKLVDPMGKEISSESANPIVIAVDVTGSMASWPGEIFDRLPLLFQTLSQYREDAEFSFCAIGDAYSDQYPLQVNDFGSGVGLEDHVKALGCEGGGGGQISETYELFAYFMLNHCRTPNATSPFLLIFGDEKFYSTVNPSQVQHYIGDSLESELDSAKVWSGLLQKFNVHFLQKPYGHGDPGITRDVRSHWENVLGSQRVLGLEDEQRAVDLAMGLIAKQWGEYSDFNKNLSARQADPVVRESVHRSLRHIPDAKSTRSVVGGSSGRSKSVSISELFADAKSVGGRK